MAFDIELIDPVYYVPKAFFPCFTCEYTYDKNVESFGGIRQQTLNPIHKLGGGT